MADPKLNQELDVEFRDSQRLVFSGKAKAVSSRNSRGRFDILPQHTQFISLINDEVLIYGDQAEPKRFPLTTGVLRCVDNKVTIFTGLDSQAKATT